MIFGNRALDEGLEQRSFDRGAELNDVVSEQPRRDVRDRQLMRPNNIVEGFSREIEIESRRWEVADARNEPPIGMKALDGSSKNSCAAEVAKSDACETDDAVRAARAKVLKHRNSRNRRSSENARNPHELGAACVVRARGRG